MAVPAERQDDAENPSQGGGAIPGNRTLSERMRKQCALAADVSSKSKTTKLGVGWD